MDVLCSCWFEKNKISPFRFLCVCRISYMRSLWEGSDNICCWFENNRVYILALKLFSMVYTSLGFDKFFIPLFLCDFVDYYWELDFNGWLRILTWFKIKDISPCWEHNTPPVTRHKLLLLLQTTSISGWAEFGKRIVCRGAQDND